MGRLINIDELREAFRHDIMGGLNWERILREAKTVDAVQVRHGKWMEIPEAEMFMCSECGEPGLSFDDVYIYDLKPANFCPNCGADMRKDGDDGKAD